MLAQLHVSSARSEDSDNQGEEQIEEESSLTHTRAHIRTHTELSQKHPVYLFSDIVREQVGIQQANI